MAYLGEEPKFGSFASERFSGNGSATSFTLTYGAASPNSLLVTIDGVKQQTTAYSITDTALDFGSGNAPPTGTNNIEVIYLGTKTLVGGVTDASISTAKIDNNAVTGAKIAMGSDAAGDILTYTGTDYVRLAKGTANQALKMNAGATAVEWTGGGKVLQVVSTNLNTTFTYSSRTFGDITGLSLAITPSATSSKILVSYDTVTTSSGSYHYFLKVVRLISSTTTQLGLPATAGSRILTQIGSHGWNTIGPDSHASFTYLDSPSSVAAITYKVQVSAEGTFYLNRSIDDTDNIDFGRYVSNITAMEIGV